MKPRLLPNFLFLALAKRRAAGLLKNDVFKYYPHQAQRLKGIAEGAEIDLSTALFFQSLELFIGTWNFVIPACTSLGFTPEKTWKREIVIAKNFDYLNALEPYNITCKVAPEGRFRTLGSTIAALPGMLEAINEHGLIVTYNLAFTTQKPKCYAPLSMALQEMLETCKDTKEALEFLSRAKRGGHDALLMLADTKGDLKTVEITSRHAATRGVKQGLLVNTNHYLTKEMQQYEVPWQAIIHGKAPRHLLGHRVHESSEQRLKRVNELLKGKNRVEESEILRILRDHGAEEEPSENTLCRHGAWASTIRSNIFYPESKTMKVLYGTPCYNTYEEFRLN